MKERPDIDDLKKKLKGENQSENNAQESDDMLRARLKGSPESDHGDEVKNEAPDNIDGPGRQTPEGSYAKPAEEILEELPSEPEEQEIGEETGNDDEGIETFTRDGKTISVDTASQSNSSAETAGVKQAHRDKGAGNPFKKKAGRPKPKKKREPFKTHLKKPKRVQVCTNLILLSLLFLGVLVWYVFSSASSVKEISIAGNSLISDEEIADRLQFADGDKMFSIDISRAEENISLLPAVEDVEVKRSWWNGVDVNISEYRALGYVTNESSYYPVLENARVLRGYPAAPKAAPILHYFEGEEFDAIVSSLSEIEPSILDGISEIYYRPSEQSSTRIHMFMNDGQEIVADYRTIDDKMNHYIGMRNEIGDSTAGVIDLEIGSSFLPYESAEAQDIKQGIYETPVQAQYIEDVSGSLGDVKSVLSDFGDGEE
ncbi:cell division protein FtsQ/DivIB [Salinicoccus sp. HZC-1]|uniref:cell division protein FtsQ/DivIB n=1 Tax=Salinicoccus sp. HZC-1 TaxID=3385497 RepID=UPI00398B14C4